MVHWCTARNFDLSESKRTSAAPDIIYNSPPPKKNKRRKENQNWTKRKCTKKIKNKLIARSTFEIQSHTLGNISYVNVTWTYRVAHLAIIYHENDKHLYPGVHFPSRIYIYQILPPTYRLLVALSFCLPPWLYCRSPKLIIPPFFFFFMWNKILKDKANDT